MNDTPDIPETPTQREILEKLVEQACDQISEHALSVRILVTYQTEDGEANSASLTEGRGSIYAQIGQTQEWLDAQREYNREKARREWQEDNED